MPRLRRLAVALAALAAVMLAMWALPATAAAPTQVFASFTGTSAGTLQTTPLSIVGCPAGTLATSDLSGAAFSPAGATTEATVSCTTLAVTVQLDAPVAGLDLYLVDLPELAPCTDGVYGITTDGAGITIGSGFASASLVGPTLTVPFPGPDSGVIHVAGPVTTVRLASEGGAVPLTFTVGTAFVEPTTTTTVAPTTVAPVTTAPGAVVGASGASVTPAFTC
jgi:hypothetical protein